MLGRADDHPAGCSRVAERVVVTVRNAEEARKAAQTMIVEVGPGTPGDTDAVEPARFDHRPIVDTARRGEGALVEERVRDGESSGPVPVDRGMDVREGRLPDDMVRGDAVDADIARVELVARVEQRLPGEDLAAVAEADDANLADAADSRARRLDVDHDEVGRGIVGNRCDHRS